MQRRCGHQASRASADDDSIVNHGGSKNGKRKPSLQAFAFPFFASVSGHRGFGWGRAPESPPVKVTVQFVSGGSPVAGVAAQVATRETDPVPFMIPGGSVAITAINNLTVGASLGGASSLQVTKWSVEIKNALDDAIQTVALNREDVLWLTADYDLDDILAQLSIRSSDVVPSAGSGTISGGTTCGSSGCRRSSV